MTKWRPDYVVGQGISDADRPDVPTPVDYDSLVAELGETPGEPRLVVKAFRAGQLVYYVNYDIKGADS